MEQQRKTIAAIVVIVALAVVAGVVLGRFTAGNDDPGAPPIAVIDYCGAESGQAARNATLPPDMEEPTIDTMRVGHTAYVGAYAMWVDDPQRRLWLHAKHTVSKTPDGARDMRVERRADGYHVWTPDDAKYMPTQPVCVQKWIAVVGLHRS
jgi:hypothetical protein